MRSNHQFSGTKKHLMHVLTFLLALTLPAQEIEVESEFSTALTEEYILDLIHRNEADSLMALTSSYLEYARSGHPELLPEALFLRGQAKTYEFELDEAIELSRKCITLVKGKQDPLEFKARSLLARNYDYDGQLDSARFQYEHILTHQEPMDSSLFAEVYYGLYAIGTKEGKDEEGLDYLYKALELFEATGEHSFAASIRSYIGVIYHNLDQDSLAIDYQNEALEYFLLHKEQDNATYVYLERGNIYLDMEQLEKAEADLLEAVGISEETGHVGNFANGCSLLGELYRKMKRYDEAIEKHQLSLDMCREYDIPIGIVTCDMNLGLLYIDLNEPEKALTYAEEMELISEREGFSELLLKAKGQLSTIHAMMGQYEEAYIHKQAEFDLRDSLFTIEKTEVIGELREKFEREKNLRELDELKNQAEMDKLKRNALFGGLILTMLLAGAIVNREIKRRKKAKALFKTELKLAEVEKERLQERLDFKNRELTSNALNMARKNEFIMEITEHLDEKEVSPEHRIKRIKNQLKVEGQMESNWEQFTELFKETNPSFYHSLTSQFPNLSKGDLRLAALIRMNMGNKDIARMLSISDDGVKKSRYRLRKKLGLETDESLEARIMRI